MPITQTIKKTCCPCVLCLSSEITHAAVKTNIYIFVGREENSKLCSKVGCQFYIHSLKLKENNNSGWSMNYLRILCDQNFYKNDNLYH